MIFCKNAPEVVFISAKSFILKPYIGFCTAVIKLVHQNYLDWSVIQTEVAVHKCCKNRCCTNC